MTIKMQEAPIDEVFKYFVEGFKPADGSKIVNFESNYDPRTGNVIFKLFVKAKGES